MDFKESESTVFCADFRLYKHICIFLGKESISFISIPSFKSLPLNSRNLGVLALKLWQGPHLCPLRLQLLPWTVRGLGKRPLGLLSRVWICPGSPWSSPPPRPYSSWPFGRRCHSHLLNSGSFLPNHPPGDLDTGWVTLLLGKVSLS